MTKKETIKFMIVMFSSFVIGSLVTLIFIKIMNIKNQSSYMITKDNTKIYEKTSLSTSIEKIRDAVVVVQGYKENIINETGSGFIYKIDKNYGYILTNEHVISESPLVKIVTANDEEVTATVLGKDSYLDLAVLRIDKKYVQLIATIGSSDKMNIGDTVFTVGAPLGYNYRGSVTSGILSGKERMVSINLTEHKDLDWVMKVLQIDASINPGNSGGPLLNVNGEVIGICSLKLVKNNIEGMGFAIPIEYAMSHVETLEQGKSIEWPTLGISMINVTDKETLMSNNLQVQNTIKEGVVILNVKSGTSAELAGLMRGDIITHINSTKVKDIAYLKYELYQHQSKDTITITYIRNAKNYTKKITLD